MANGTSSTLPSHEMAKISVHEKQICVNYGAQLGASAVLLLVVFLTKSSGRATPIFWINIVLLVSNIIRNGVLSFQFANAPQDAYLRSGTYHPQIKPAHLAIILATEISTWVIFGCLEISLYLQTRAVCIDVHKLYGQILHGFSLCISVVAIIFRISSSCIAIAKDGIRLGKDSGSDWLSKTTSITTTINICWFCLLLLTTLGFAIRRRRMLGLKRFGALHVLIIMNAQIFVTIGNVLQPIFLRYETYKVLQSRPVF